MLKHGLKLTACIGVVGAGLLAGDASAMTHEECIRLPANQYLAAIERGVCEINLETAAGPQQEASTDDGDGNRDGRNGGGNNGGGNRSGGSGKTGGSSPNGGRGTPGKP